MIKINKVYLNRFTRTINGYNYIVNYGVYLSFNKELEYQGVETYYNPYNIGKVYQQCERKLGELYAKGLIDIYE